MLHDEIDKLASNLGYGRCFGGTQYRSDVTQGLLYGEEIGLQMIQQALSTLSVPFYGRFRARTGTFVELHHEGTTNRHE
jgi:hypothetical protein